VARDVPIAEFRPLDDLDRIIGLDPAEGEKTGATVVIDGDDEDVFLIEVDGETIEAYRSRLTTGGEFVNVDDPTDTAIGLVNRASPSSSSARARRTSPRSGPTRSSAGRCRTPCSSRSPS
jgi:hypothetical protein